MHGKLISLSYQICKSLLKLSVCACFQCEQYYTSISCNQIMLRSTIHEKSTEFNVMKGLILGVYTESSEKASEIVSYTDSFKEVDEKSKGQLGEILKLTGPFHKPAKQRLLWSSLLAKDSAELEYNCLSIVDLGPKDAKDNALEGMNQKSENIRCAIAAGIKALRASSNFEDIYLDPCDNPQSVAEAAYLVTHCFDVLKKKSSKPIIKLHLYKCGSLQPSSVTEFEKGVKIAKCQNFARILAETPANHMTPSIFASTVAEKCNNTQVKVIIRDKDWIESMKMDSFLSVSKGSEEPPRFLELHYDGLPDSKEHIAFVGKGITFDSGGISLKPHLDMNKMRADMGGAASVVGTILAASDLDLKLNVKGYIPLSENLPSGKANKPGDVVFAMNGKSIQIDNTDAEGRLVLADGLCYAQQFNPAAVVDVATLTGAMSIAVGTAAAGVFSNDEELWQLLNKAGYTTGDRVWRFPLFRHYLKDMTCAPLADLNNTGKSRKAGACTAAAFLQEFVNSDTKWMHVDMSCVKENNDDVPYLSSGMSGRPTRTFIQFLKYLADRK